MPWARALSSMKNSEADGRRWLSQAENDLGAAQLMVERAFYAQACFMCHQVAEKALKALAYYRGDRYVLGHSLLELLREIVGTFPEIRVAHGGLEPVLRPHSISRCAARRDSIRDVQSGAGRRSCKRREPSRRCRKGAHSQLSLRADLCFRAGRPTGYNVTCT